MSVKANYQIHNEIKYSFKEIDCLQKGWQISCSISNNEQYLAYGGINKILIIYDIKQDQIHNEINIDLIINVCQFTSDSSILFIGCGNGYVIGYNVLKNFQLMFTLQIHQSPVFNIRTIKNKYLITSSDDKRIIKTEIYRKKQIFKLIGHTGLILGIDYNSNDDIIISGSYDQSIKFWDCMNRCIIINKQQSHPNRIRQIQLINNNQYLLSLDDSYNLYKWEIDLFNKDLIKIQEFKFIYHIYSFHYTNFDQNLLLICGQYIKILSNKGETSFLAYHEAGEFYTPQQSRQLDSLRYIHIKSFRKILSLDRQNRVGDQIKLNQKNLQ